VGGLRAVLDEMGKRGRPGTKAFRVLVEKLERSTGHAASGLEADFLEIAETAGFPPPELQVELGDADGPIGRVDAFWRPRLVVEVDSERFHTAPLDVEADRIRDERLTRAGYLVRRVPEFDIRNRKRAVADRLRLAMREAA
jgi:hypothetical protein